MEERSRAVTIIVKILLTVVILIPGLALVGYLTSEHGAIGSFLCIGLLFGIGAIWKYNPQ